MKIALIFVALLLADPRCQATEADYEKLKELKQRIADPPLPPGPDGWAGVTTTP